MTVHSEKAKRANGDPFTRYIITYYEGRNRKRTNRSTLRKAKLDAAEIAARISRQEAHVLELTGRRLQDFKAAESMVIPYKISLLEAVTQWSNAREGLPADVTLSEVVADYVKRKNAVVEPLTVAELVDRYIPLQKTRGMGIETRRKRAERARQFVKVFGTMPVHTLTSPMLVTYYEGAGKAPWTKKSHAKLLSSLFQFAVSHKHASVDLLEELKVANTHLPKIKRGSIRGLVYSPAEMLEILKCARPGLVPEIVLMAFCGIRRNEIIHREKPALDWSQIKLDRGQIDLDIEQAKAEHRRLAPIPDNAKAWLEPYAKKSGCIALVTDPNKISTMIKFDVNKARKANGDETPFHYRKNGFRHSFISYRVADIQDVAKVALEAGNSVEQIHATYREVRTHEEAAEYFAITPKKPGAA